MESTEQRAMTALTGASTFIDDNAESLGAVARCAAKVKLDRLIATLTAHGAEQVQSTWESRAATQVLQAGRRELLHWHLGAIIAVAQALSDRIPALRVLRMPHPYSSLATLLSSAQTIREAAGEHVEVFVTAGLEADYLLQLDAAITRMVDAAASRRNARGRGVGATRGIRVTISAARKQVAILDRLVRMALAGDEALLQNWKQVKRTRLSSSRQPVATEPAVALEDIRGEELENGGVSPSSRLDLEPHGGVAESDTQTHRPLSLLPDEPWNDATSSSTSRSTPPSAPSYPTSGASPAGRGMPTIHSPSASPPVIPRRPEAPSGPVSHRDHRSRRAG